MDTAGYLPKTLNKASPGGVVTLASGLLLTGQVARALGVCQRTVAKWIDTGLLRGYRIPSTNGKRSDRRVCPKDLARFMEKHGMPIPRELVKYLREEPTDANAGNA